MNDQDFEWQFELAACWKQVASSALGLEDTDAGRTVEDEIKAFAKQRLGEIMGRPSRSTEVSVPRGYKPATPLLRQPPRRQPAPERTPAIPPRPAPKLQPKVAQQPLNKAREVKKEDNVVPIDGQIVKKGGRVFKYRWTQVDPESFKPEISSKVLTMNVSQEGLQFGEQWITHPSEDEWFLVRRKDVTGQTGSKDAAPWRQDFVEAAMASKASSAGRFQGDLKDADARASGSRDMMMGEVKWNI